MFNCQSFFTEGRRSRSTTARFRASATRASRLRYPALLASLSLFAGLLVAQAETVVRQSADEPYHKVPLTVPTKASLANLQENWLQWDSAFLRSDQDQAENVTEDLIASAAELGMSRLPDLCFAVLARARESAVEGNTTRARWAIAMADRLDPGRPETHFAKAMVARVERAFVESLFETLRGYQRMLHDRFLRSIFWGNLATWAMVTALLAGGLFVTLQVLVHGRHVIEELGDVLARYVHPTLAYAVALLATFWPILLQGGLRLLFVYWTILVWRYAKRAERLVVAAVVALLAIGPTLLQFELNRMQVRFSGPYRALDSLQADRLYGGLFNDLEALSETLPGNIALKQLNADLHSRLGQGEFARSMYEEVVEAEPSNQVAHNNLGGYYLMHREFGVSIEHLQAATRLAPDRAEPYFNLHQVYAETLSIEEAVKMLSEGRSRDPASIAEWERTKPVFVSFPRNLYGREREVRRDLFAAGPALFESDMLPRSAAAAALPLVLCVAVAALILILLSRLGGLVSLSSESRRGTLWWRLALLLIPGLRSLLRGRALIAYGAVLIPIGPLVLVQLNRLGYPPPLGFRPESVLSWMLLIVTLLVYYGVRWHLSKRETG